MAVGAALGEEAVLANAGWAGEVAAGGGQVRMRHGEGMDQADA